MWGGIFNKILSVPQNIVMDLNNVMHFSHNKVSDTIRPVTLTTIKSVDL